MKPELRNAYRSEHAAADTAIARGELDVAFAHTWTHLRMFAIGWRRYDAREVVGQVFRSIAALTKSKIWVPLGNTGGANVNPFQPMPVPPDLRAYLD